MYIILSSRNPRDSWYSTDAGQVLYKVSKSDSGVTTLRKAMNGDDNFTQYAEVEFHRFKPTRFRFNNVIDVSVEEYFRKEGLLNPDWVFRAADKREYYWKLDGAHLEMFRKDGEKEIVKFQEPKRSFGPFITGRPASLEVDDSCMPILDEIMMTFICCQKQRKRRQANSRPGAGGLPAGIVFAGGVS